MSLTGRLSTMPLSDLLQWLDTTRKTGTLVLDNLESRTTLFLNKGKIVSSSSTDPRCYFGQFLLAHTPLTEDQLRRAFERQEKTRVYLGKNIYIKTLLGKILLDEGLLPEPEITRVLRIKTEETVYGAFLWPDGTFQFLANELPPEELVPISIDIVEVINRGIGRIEEWRDIRSRIPSNQAYFRVDTQKMPDGLHRDETARRLLPLLVQGRTVADAMLTLHSTEFAVNHAVYRFLRDGFVQLLGERATAATEPAPTVVRRPSAELLEQGRQLFDQRAYADTIRAAREALREDPINPEARSLLERSEQELTESYYARFFAKSDVPTLRQPLAPGDAALLSAEERFLLERVNGEWSIGSICKVSPLRELEAVAIFKRFLDRGLISLRRGA